MEIQPYLFFNGRCEEAIGHYRDALGARVGLLMRFRDSPDPAPDGMVPAGWEDKIMHAELRVGEAVVMMSDGCVETSPGFQGFSLALTAPDAAIADRMFAALCDGGKVEMPMGETFFSPRFGIVTDRFGVSWMLTLPPKTSESA